ncbi:hypothetical protein AVEN_63256-1 [Araneus ventricosus]|uniref:Uncharacterized protein n=1 Tax=Araneus ventricosus TaxID=182803 RepID=A0A4Y2B4G6_ARAVE|nr:hypothetical protein AVEN_63256-1 [Araneus ventricosus]
MREDGRTELNSHLKTICIGCSIDTDIRALQRSVGKPRLKQGWVLGLTGGSLAGEGRDSSFFLSHLAPITKASPRPFFGKALFASLLQDASSSLVLTPIGRTKSNSRQDGMYNAFFSEFRMGMYFFSMIRFIFMFDIKE